MVEFNFKSQICTTVEQSQRLLSLGLKKETADMVHYRSSSMKEWGILATPWRGDCEGCKCYYPAWSLHRLIEIIQDVCSRIIMAHSWVRIENRCMPYIDYSCDSFDNTYDNIISCIEWLIKEGYFNKKEYLVDLTCTNLHQNMVDAFGNAFEVMKAMKIRKKEEKA